MSGFVRLMGLIRMVTFVDLVEVSKDKFSLKTWWYVAWEYFYCLVLCQQNTVQWVIEHVHLKKVTTQWVLKKNMSLENVKLLALNYRCVRCCQCSIFNLLFNSNFPTSRWDVMRILMDFMTSGNNFTKACCQINNASSTIEVVKLNEK